MNFFKLKVNNSVATAVDPRVNRLKVDSLICQVENPLNLDHRYNLLNSEFSPLQLGFFG